MSSCLISLVKSTSGATLSGAVKLPSVLGSGLLRLQTHYALGPWKGSPFLQQQQLPPISQITNSRHTQPLTKVSRPKGKCSVFQFDHRKSNFPRELSSFSKHVELTKYQCRQIITHHWTPFFSKPSFMSLYPSLERKGKKQKHSLYCLGRGDVLLKTSISIGIMEAVVCYGKNCSIIITFQVRMG